MSEFHRESQGIEIELSFPTME